MVTVYFKAADPNSNGYDPYDYFDLGDYNQKGSVKTAFGNSERLRRLIRAIHEKGMGAIADMVINHNSGVDEEVNPLDGNHAGLNSIPKAVTFRAIGILSIPAAMNG